MYTFLQRGSLPHLLGTSPSSDPPDPCTPTPTPLILLLSDALLFPNPAVQELAQSEVADLEDAILIDKNVPRFQVPVDDALVVDVIQAQEDLPECRERVQEELLLGGAFRPVPDKVREGNGCAQLHLDVQADLVLVSVGVRG